MNNIEPYENISDALKALDNGGRFYNVLTKANDGVINQTEIGKVAGVFNNKQQIILFLELSICNLSQSEKNLIISKFDDDLLKNYQKYKPQLLLPFEAESKGEISASAIITGIPKLIESKSDFTGFIMFPLVIGEITTISMIPMIDEYDVYEVRDENSTEPFLIAHTKGSQKLPQIKIKIAGVLKELSACKKDNSNKKKYLETVYYSKF